MLKKSQAVQCRILGSFTQAQNLGETTGETKVCFTPCLESLATYKLQYHARAPTNLHSFGDLETQKVNYVSIAKECETTEQFVIQCLKQVLATVKTLPLVKLNLKIGFMKVKQGCIHFDNYATVREIDQLSRTSYLR